MDKQFYFDIGTMWRPATSSKHNEKTHKSRPTQFDSVTQGTIKRLEKNIKSRKSTRLTVFDRIRNLPTAEPTPALDPRKEKIEHRRQQLEKWKEEKEKKKKEAATQKKKPFLAGVPHVPLKYVPPPPPPKPSTSGVVTRSQRKAPVHIDTNPKQRNTKSFAPINAAFRPPDLKEVPSMFKFGPPSKTKKKEIITFEPVQSNVTVRQTRNKTHRPFAIATEAKPKPKTQKETRTTVAKQVRSTYNIVDRKTNQLTSSSSSEVEATRKPVKRTQTPKKSEPKDKPITPNQLILFSETSSSEESHKGISKRTSVRILVTSPKNCLLSSSENSCLDEPNSSLDEFKSMKHNKKQNESAKKMPIVECSVVLTKSPLIKVKTDMSMTPKTNIPKSESGSEQKLRSPKTPTASPLTPEQINLFKMISPCVTLSRGKENARKEIKWKLDEGLIYDAEDDVDYFRQQLASEVARITTRCDVWDKISEQNTLPESVQELVLSAVGQSRLLVSQKLRQFASLVETAAAPQPDATVVTTTDLRGFWDMVYMQVENIDMKFKKLEELRDRNWVEEQSPILKKAVRTSPAKNINKQSTAVTRLRDVKKSTAVSRLRDVIAAARKANKMQQDAPPGSPGVSSSEAPDEKTFEAGFFTVRSPVQSPAPTPTKQTLLKAVLSNEAKKTVSRNSTSFAMLRASILGKTPELDGIAPLPQTPVVKPINLDATPARSILKSGNVQSSNTKLNRSVKLVLFEDNNSSEEETMKNDEEEREENVSKTSNVTAIRSRRNINTSQIADISQRSTSDENLEETLTKNKQDEIKENSSDNEISPVHKKPGKYVRRKKLVRQDHIYDQDEDIEDVITPRRMTLRRRDKQAKEDTCEKTPAKNTSVKKTPRRSTGKKALQELELNVMEELVPTPHRSLRSRKSVGAQNVVK